MRLRKLVFLTSILMLMCAFAAAQTQPSDSASDTAKKKKDLDERVVQMLDEAVSDAAGLRLPQNRAIVYALAGDLYWKIDEKHSRELFRNSAAEIVTYNAEAEREMMSLSIEGITDAITSMMDPSDPRADVVNLISKHDADLALEILLQTRSAKLADAMAKAAVATDTQPDIGSMGLNMDKIRTMQETALEQRLSQLAAGSDPDKLVKLIKDSMAKSVTYSLIPLLQRLNEKDMKKAGELGAEVIAKLADADMARSQEDLRTALNFLQTGLRPAPAAESKVKPFAFTDASLKDLANKLLNALLQPSKSMMTTMMVTQSIPVLEKFVPEKIGLLKQRDAENKKSVPTEMKAVMNMQKAWDPNATPEDLLAQLSKLTNENDKRMLYPLLANKIGQVTDEARAKKLIDQIPDEKMRANAQEQFDSASIGRATAAGKVDEARRFIGAMTNRKMKIQRLVALATQVQKKGTEKDIETAKNLMTDAKSLTKDFPEDEDDLGDIMEVIKGYATVDADTAFRMFEPIINEFNDIVQASAVLSKYNKRDRTFKKGEIVIKLNGNFATSVGGGTNVLLFRYIPQFQMLGKADLDRMSVLSGLFSRGDTRTIVKLFVLQGFLAEDRKPVISVPATGAGVRINF